MTGSLNAEVKDKDTGKVIRNALVEILQLNLTARTPADRDAAAHFPEIPAETYSVKASADGYKSFTRTGTKITENQLAVRTLKLEPLAEKVAVPPVPPEKEPEEITPEVPAVEEKAEERDFPATKAKPDATFIGIPKTPADEIITIDGKQYTRAELERAAERLAATPYMVGHLDVRKPEDWAEGLALAVSLLGGGYLGIRALAAVAPLVASMGGRGFMTGFANLSRSQQGTLIKHMATTPAGRAALRNAATGTGKTVVATAGKTGLLATLKKPSTWIFGIVGGLSLAYGIPFGTSWLAKEGLIEQVMIPLQDALRDDRWCAARDKLPKLKSAIDDAEKAISMVAWAWPPTTSTWFEYITLARSEYDDAKKLIDAGLAKATLKVASNQIMNKLEFDGRPHAIEFGGLTATLRNLTVAGTHVLTTGSQGFEDIKQPIVLDPCKEETIDITFSGEPEAVRRVLKIDAPAGSHVFDKNENNLGLTSEWSDEFPIGTTVTLDVRHPDYEDAGFRDIVITKGDTPQVYEAFMKAKVPEEEVEELVTIDLITPFAVDTLTLDGNLVETFGKKAIPLEGLEIKDHVLTLEFEGYAPVQITITEEELRAAFEAEQSFRAEITEGDLTRITPVDVPTKYGVTISSDPAGAAVTIDGVGVIKNTPVRVLLEKGTYTLGFDAFKHDHKDVEVTIP